MNSHSTVKEEKEKEKKSKGFLNGIPDLLWVLEICLYLKKKNKP